MNLTLHLTHMTNSLHNIACSWFTLSTNHGSTLVDTTESLSKITSTTYERHIELALVNMINIIGRRKNLALVNIVNLYSFEYLSLNKMTNTAFCHYRNRYCLLNTFNHLWIAHTRNASCSSNIGRNSLQSHYCTRTSSLSDTSLLWGCYIHYHSALQHLSQVAVQSSSIFHIFSFIFRL